MGATSERGEVWIATSGKEAKLPNFEFTEAAATPEESQKARLAMRDVLTFKGVVFLDLDESCGCIVVGAATKEVNPRIASFIKELGIDARWVNVVQTPEYRLTAALDGIQKDLGNFTFDQAGLDASFDQDGEFYTSNVDDRLTVKVERGVVPSDQIEVVLVAAPGISARKDIILEEGRNGVNGRWTIWTSGTVTTARNGLYTYQLPGGFMEFRKRVGNNNNNGMEYVEPHASRRFHGSHGTVRSIRHPQTYAA
jgi:hypothetical protein